MLIRVENCQNIVEIQPELNEMIDKVVKLCMEEEDFTIPSEINIVFVDDEEMKELNNEHRGIDKTTDVLSFPMAEVEKGQLLSGDYDKDPKTGLLVLGDVVISSEKCVKQADEYSHSFERELMFLITHGIFHILGYDHQNKEEETEMFEKQEKVLSKIGLKRG